MEKLYMHVVTGAMATREDWELSVSRDEIEERGFASPAHCFDHDLGDGIFVEVDQIKFDGQRYQFQNFKTGSYIENHPAEPSSRVLDGSSDHGFESEWVGYGMYQGLPVRAIYLFSESDEWSEDGDFLGDWESKIARLEVDVDKMTDIEFRNFKEAVCQ